MPNIMEISGLLSGRRMRIGRRKHRGLRGDPGIMDLRDALGRGRMGKKHKKMRKPGKRAMQALPGGNAAQKLAVAEKMFAEGKKPLAIAWARQAENRAIAEGNSAVKHRATQMIKMIRGEFAAKLLSGFGDVDGIVLGRLYGIW